MRSIETYAIDICNECMTAHAKGMAFVKVMSLAGEADDSEIAAEVCDRMAEFESAFLYVREPLANGGANLIFSGWSE